MELRLLGFLGLLHPKNFTYIREDIFIPDATATKSQELPKLEICSEHQTYISVSMYS